MTKCFRKQWLSGCWSIETPCGRLWGIYGVEYGFVCRSAC